MKRRYKDFHYWPPALTHFSHVGGTKILILCYLYGVETVRQEVVQYKNIILFDGSHRSKNYHMVYKELNKLIQRLLKKKKASRNTKSENKPL